MLIDSVQPRTFTSRFRPINLAVKAFIDEFAILLRHGIAFGSGYAVGHGLGAPAGFMDHSRLDIHLCKRLITAG